MAEPWTEKTYAYFILAVIFVAFFLLALIQGIKIQWGGELEVAFLFYLVAAILAGMAKICKLEMHREMCKPTTKLVVRKAKKRRR